MTTPQNNQPEFSPQEPEGFAEQQPLDSAIDDTAVDSTAVNDTAVDNTAVNNTSSSTSNKKSKKASTAKVESSIAGSTWVALILGILLLILLLVFILQNQESAELQLFAWTMNFPIGVGMLIAAIVGALVMALVGGVRIMQLRRQVARH